MEELRAAIRAARSELETSQKRLADAEERIPKGPPDNKFANELEAVAAAAGIRQESTPPPGAPQTDGTYNAVQVSVEGSGDWESCLRFLRGISEMKRLSRLDLVVLDTEREGMAQGTASSTCHILVKFSAFYRE